jgi:hypothetical protein
MTIPVENKAIFGNKAFKNKKKMIINWKRDEVEKVDIAVIKR